MTLVIDSDDINGIEDAYKMVRIMHTKYVGSLGAHKKSFGKIEYIKALRKFGREAVESYKTDEGFDIEDIASLRFTKRFADEIWRNTGE
ncbi:MAG: hypothetical protein VX978_05855 [Pseudomonadota bacterium]|nr:hypothetical protein [Pseudomonadota bacterium]